MVKGQVEINWDGLLCRLLAAAAAASSDFVYASGQLSDMYITS